MTLKPWSSSSRRPGDGIIGVGQHSCLGSETSKDIDGARKMASESGC